MSMHKGLIGKSEGGASVKPDVTLSDYIERKTENMGELGVSREMERCLIAERQHSHQWLIDRRIACPEAGYPSSEARFDNVFEYVMYLENK